MIIVRNNKEVEVPLTSGYQFRESLMKDNLLIVSFELKDRETFPIGSYILIDAKKYVLLDNYEPEQVEGGFKYEMEFEHEFFKIKNKLFTYKGQVVETAWNIRADAMTVMQTVVDAINRELGVVVSYAVDDKLVGTKLLEFNNVNIFDGLNKIAEAWDTEWWYDGVIHLGKASKGEYFRLEVGNNIGVPRVQKKDKQYTRFYAFGSTKNIPQDYAPNASLVYADKRLSLPNGFIDVRPNLTIDEIVPYVVEFPNIYPRSQLVIEDVKLETKDYTDSDGKIVPEKKIYYYTIKVKDFELTQDLILPNQIANITFDSGVLVGETFEVNIDKGIKLIYKEESGWILPNATLRPQVGDKVIFSNIKMPPKYVTDAEAELERETRKLIDEKTEDNREFVVETNLNNTKELFVGDNVLLVNGNWSLKTRVIKREVSFDDPEIGVYTLANFYQKGVFRELKEDINRISTETRLLNAMQIQAQYDNNRNGNNSQRVNDFILNYEKYGNIGILVYPAGVYDETKEYTATEIERPMVEYNGGRYILNKQGTFKGVTPEDGDIWNKTTDFKAIYTQILFAEFAKLGSFVFSGDFMMSQFGYDNDGNLTQDYQNFPTNFNPIFQVNGKTGDVVMNDATINNATLNNVYANGKIANKPFKVEATNISLSNSYYFELFKFSGVIDRKMMPSSIPVRDIGAILTFRANDTNHSFTLWTGYATFNWAGLEKIVVDGGEILQLAPVVEDGYDESKPDSLAKVRYWKVLNPESKSFVIKKDDIRTHRGVDVATCKGGNYADYRVPSELFKTYKINKLVIQNEGPVKSYEFGYSSFTYPIGFSFDVVNMGTSNFKIQLDNSILTVKPKDVVHMIFDAMSFTTGKQQFFIAKMDTYQN